ncbi:MAG: hypothetical protein Q4G28_03590 [Neisseria sp.]|nr:hypothetical protein [Neisseria sp.]
MTFLKMFSDGLKALQNLPLAAPTQLVAPAQAGAQSEASLQLSAGQR